MLAIIIRDFILVELDLKMPNQLKGMALWDAVLSLPVLSVVATYIELVFVTKYIIHIKLIA